MIFVESVASQFSKLIVHQPIQSPDFVRPHNNSLFIHCLSSIVLAAASAHTRRRSLISVLPSALHTRIVPRSFATPAHHPFFILYTFHTLFIRQVVFTPASEPSNKVSILPDPTPHFNVATLVAQHCTQNKYLKKDCFILSLLPAPEYTYIRTPDSAIIRS